MSKVIITMDTETKTLSVKAEGKPIENVREVSAYQYFSDKMEPNGFSCSVMTFEQSGDIRKVTTYYASAAEAAIAEGKEVDKVSIPGLSIVVNSVESSLKADIQNFIAGYGKVNFNHEKS